MNTSNRRLSARPGLLATAPVLAWACIVATGCGGQYSAGIAGGDSGADVTADAGPGPLTDAGGGEATSVPVDAGSSPGDGGPGSGFAPAAHRAFPQVPDTGKTMNAPSLVTIVASNDAPTDGTDTAASLQAFSDVLPGSAVWSAVSSEYQLGTLSSVAHVSGPTLAAAAYSESQIATYVGNLITAGTAPSPSGNTVYLLYLPDGASLSFTDDCAWHFASTTAGDEIAIAMRCTPWPGETQLGELTRLASGVVVGAATDPLGQGYNLGEPMAQPWNGSIWQSWVSGGHVELESLCEGTRTFESAAGAPPGGWELQRIYSNAAAAAGGDPCVPPYGEPFYSLSAPQDWYSVQPGGTVTIPLVGWSTAQTSDWLMYAHVSETNTTGAFDGLSDGGVPVSSEIGIGTVGGCDVRYALNNGTAASVEVTASPTAPSGSYVVFRMDAFRENPPPSCDSPITGDDFHFWPVGVYVP